LLVTTKTSGDFNELNIHDELDKMDENEVCSGRIGFRKHESSLL